MPEIEIHYRRPPDRLDIFVQDLVVDEPDHKITLHDPSSLTTALTVGDQVIQEPGAPIVWYVFPNTWYDIGRFHLEDGSFTGYYVNLIVPPELGERRWTIYDLCLDVWLDPNGSYIVLDQDEFDEAVDNHWIDTTTAQRTRHELDGVLQKLAAGRFPPDVVQRYPLKRVRQLRAQRRLATEPR
jgi:predicted RNA-binding protein associated with RNAse of E/G family